MLKMKLGKINFFKRIYLAITDFRMYPYAQKEKLSTAIGYFTKLLVLIAIVIGAFVTSNFFKDSPILLGVYNENMPNFIVKNGTLETEEIIEKELNSNTYLFLNNDYSYSELNKITISEEGSYNLYVLMLSDASVLGYRLENGIHELGRIEYENLTFTKEQLANEWEMLNNSAISKLVVWFFVSIGVLVVLAIVKLWTLVMYLISTCVINFMFGLKLRFTDYLKIVVYASTLPIILEVIALIFVGNVSESVNFISVSVSCVYIFYALRAIKIDSLILGGSGKTAEEKIKSALEHAQKELEKQLEEIEKKEESERNKEEEKKEIEKLNTELKEKEENLIKAQKEYEEVLNKVIALTEESCRTQIMIENAKKELKKDETKEENNDTEKRDDN